MKPYPSTLVGALACLLAISSPGLEAADRKAAPQSEQKLPQEQLPQKLVGQCTMPERVAVTGLTVDPPQPLPGSLVTVTLTIKNMCNGLLANVPWRIELVGPKGQVLGSGIQQNVAAGTSFNVAVKWTASAGQRDFRGTVDPDNTLREMTAQNRENNYKDLIVNVPQVSASTQSPGQTGPRLVESWLDGNEAKRVGAGFPARLEGAAACSWMAATMYSANQQVSVLPSDFRGPYISFGINCATGARVTLEAFKDFRLKHGWKVKGPPRILHASSDSNWRWLDAPPTSGDDPHLTMRLFTSAPLNNVLVYVAVLIEGPEGTNPYY
jgi:hypothetical protein